MVDASEFEVSLQERKAVHRPTGCIFTFYDYESIDDVEPHLVRNPNPGDLSEDCQTLELVRAATDAYKAALLARNREA